FAAPGRTRSEEGGVDLRSGKQRRRAGLFPSTYATHQRDRVLGPRPASRAIGDDDRRIGPSNPTGAPPALNSDDGDRDVVRHASVASERYFEFFTRFRYSPLREGLIWATAHSGGDSFPRFVYWMIKNICWRLDRDVSRG